MPVNPPESLFWELQWLVRCGLTPMEALKAATATAARLIKGASSYGTIEVGKVADILVVSADPLANMENLARTSAVLKSGEIYVRNGQLTWPEVIREPRPRPIGPLPALHQEVQVSPSTVAQDS